MTISTHVLALFIGMIYPAYFLFTYKKTSRRLKNDDHYRLVDYKQTIFIFWMVTLLIIGNAFFGKSMPLDFYPTFNTVGIVLASIILLFIGLQIVTSKVSTREKAESIIEKMKDSYHYLPKSRHEFIWFNLLSLSAGVCEEIIFRLFMFSYLLETTNVATAFILTNIIFAITHIGSGKQNMIGAFILGLLFTAIYYFTNIWLAMILHTAIDISTGALGYYAHEFEKRYKEVSDDLNL
jgi:membrane protease YdiL (CAAX protease family)